MADNKKAPVDQQNVIGGTGKTKGGATVDPTLNYTNIQGSESSWYLQKQSKGSDKPKK